MHLHNFIFCYYPYIAIFIFIFGSIYRYEKGQYNWKSSSSQILRKDYLFWASNLFHFGIIFLLFGHFFGLLMPKSIYSYFITPEYKQILAMISGGIAGFFSFIGINMLLYRRLFDVRVKSISNVSDVLILVLLYIQLLIGLLSIFVTYNHLNDATSMLALASWVQGIFTFSPNISDYVLNEHLIFKFHLFLGMTIFLIFPFTRLVHVFSFPYLYFFRIGYQIVRKYK